jgi:hypothetical protein
MLEQIKKIIGEKPSWRVLDWSKNWFFNRKVVSQSFLN